jgi:hypothetical protein
MPNSEYTDNPYTLLAIRAIKEDAVKVMLQEITAILDDETIISHRQAFTDYVQRKAAELLTPNQ